ncbi:hypothetical protein EWW49_10135 [Pseudomonas syringae]|uniref:hypothetical protein n=1 Tax=Pseudomonas sp. MWU16-30316 TaxID=2878093 RepID=UPI0011023175|nr:hypothetical protein [Pseudomonas sp. MWU16-30316]TFZ37281.1 hypothetical protein EWW49_10135 [Pseudomonas syringae]
MAKKHKKSAKGKQELPRHEWVYGHGTEKVSSLTVTMHPSGEVVIHEVDPATIRRQMTTTRPNGKDDKVRFSAPADHFGLELDYIEHLKTKFDYMLASDTNTISDANGPTRFEGYMVSACTIVIIAEHLQAWGREVFIQPLTSYLILDSGPDTNAELLGWHLALTRHTNTPFLHTQRLGMVVDSELGKHIDINARRVPYYADYLLPCNTALVYASSDSSDTLANAMLKYCDNVSGQLLEQFKHHGVARMLEDNHFRVGTARCFAINHPQQKRPA